MQKSKIMKLMKISKQKYKQVQLGRDRLRKNSSAQARLIFFFVSSGRAAGRKKTAFLGGVLRLEFW